MRRFLFLLPLFTAFAAGCGGSGAGRPPGTAPAKGVVQLANGKPVTGAYVKFMPTELTGVEVDAELAEDGTFVLKTIGDKEGAVPGNYKVYIDTRIPVTRAPEKAAEARRLIPTRYTSRDTSPLKAEVTTSANEFTFKLQ